MAEYEINPKSNFEACNMLKCKGNNFEILMVLGFL